jgi:hypothetical protein
MMGAKKRLRARRMKRGRPLTKFPVSLVSFPSSTEAMWTVYSGVEGCQVRIIVPSDAEIAKKGYFWLGPT